MLQSLEVETEQTVLFWERRENAENRAKNASILHPLDCNFSGLG